MVRRHEWGVTGSPYSVGDSVAASSGPATGAQYGFRWTKEGRMMPKGPAAGAGNERMLTPSKITAWLDCDHYLTLQALQDAGQLDAKGHQFGPFTQLLRRKGEQHEQDCRKELESLGCDVHSVPEKRDGELFADWAERVAPLLESDHDVLYQMPLVHDGVRGVADFLERIVDPDTGVVTWEPVDAKLARVEAKAGHVLQLCFYAEAIEALTGHAPEHLSLWLGSGSRQAIRSADVMSHWRRLRKQLRALVSEDAPGNTNPEPCTHCAFCEFAEVCDDYWDATDSLVLVANLRSADRAALNDDGVETLAALAGTEPASGAGGLSMERLEVVAGQAALQLESRRHPDQPPVFRLLEGADAENRGFAAMPEPDDGDIFFDVEGHPFWRADSGLIFLFGWLERDAGEWVYRALWAHDPHQEAQAARAFIDYVAARREQFPGMHVYHYNHTERSVLVRLTTEYGVAQTALAELIESGAFVDLLEVVRGGIQVGAQSYGLKSVERLTGYQRGHVIDKGAGAVVEYDRYSTTGDTSTLDGIAAYNEDDVRATRALRDWLIDQRPAGTPWRAPVFEADEGERVEDALVEALHGYAPDSAEHLLGDVLGYWGREGTVHRVTTLARLDADAVALLENPTVVAGLELQGREERSHATTGRPILPVLRFSFPPQTVLPTLGKGDKVMWSAGDGIAGGALIAGLDPSGTLELTWNERAEEIGHVPAAVTYNDWIRPNPKPDAVAALAQQVLDPATHRAPNPVSLALLRRDLPRFRPGEGPSNGRFTEDLDEMCTWVRHLDRSVVAVQGPPGTGKTFRGAHMVRALLDGGLRVGVTAFSHAAIGNFVDEVVSEMKKAGEIDRLHAVRNVGARSTAPAPRPGVTVVTSAAGAARPGYNLVAATTWTFANDAMVDNPVDVLIIDEAGQLALADAVAAARSAASLVLLGDPLQLAQVSQASHPGGSGASVLQHVLGEDLTLPDDRGVFLTETRRMHPDVCRFISDAIYESRLTSHPDCAVQRTAVGTGLRWLPSVHTGCSTESFEEAEVVASTIEQLLGEGWTNHRGDDGVLKASDFMVVAPYNDQVRLLRNRLDANPATAGVPVGTVDKFQGQEAAVVFFTMTSSTAADAPKGTEFLFSRNRLNVAVSRARCLAYLVCTDELVNSRARNLEEMQLFATLCSFIEYAD